VSITAYNHCGNYGRALNHGVPRAQECPIHVHNIISYMVNTTGISQSFGGGGARRGKKSIIILFVKNRGKERRRTKNGGLRRRDTFLIEIYTRHAFHIIFSSVLFSHTLYGAVEKQNIVSPQRDLLLGPSARLYICLLYTHKNEYFHVCPPHAVDS